MATMTSAPTAALASFRGRALKLAQRRPITPGTGKEWSPGRAAAPHAPSLAPEGLDQ
jgi:hypothetical protein